MRTFALKKDITIFNIYIFILKMKFTHIYKIKTVGNGHWRRKQIQWQLYTKEREEIEIKTFKICIYRFIISNQWNIDPWNRNTVPVPLTYNTVNNLIIIINEFRSFAYSTGCHVCGETVIKMLVVLRTFKLRLPACLYFCLSPLCSVFSEQKCCTSPVVMEQYVYPRRYESS